MTSQCRNVTSDTNLTQITPGSFSLVIGSTYIPSSQNHWPLSTGCYIIYEQHYRKHDRKSAQQYEAYFFLTSFINVPLSLLTFTTLSIFQNNLIAKPSFAALFDQIANMSDRISFKSTQILNIKKKSKS